MFALDNSAVATQTLSRSMEISVREGGGEYVGIQRGVPQAGSPDLVLFNDPLTGTTLALVASEAVVTMHRVRTKIAHSRMAFAAMRQKGDNAKRIRDETPYGKARGVGRQHPADALA